MFAIPPIVKKYVVIGSFRDRDWYLADADKMAVSTGGNPITTRTWTTYSKDALKFDNKSDAEQIAEIILPDNIKYKIGGISKNIQ